LIRAKGYSSLIPDSAGTRQTRDVRSVGDPDLAKDTGCRLDLFKSDPRSYAARELLENVLAREGAELSATEAIRTAQERAGSLATTAGAPASAPPSAAISRARPTKPGRRIKAGCPGP
jgi:hypothetical protein